ncbi:MAG TPA: hypothetical protein VLA19_19730 [Herpetosiphonaceae bacterium]|nr:hypothetical protein [Herpetosiphonaceae bacterium]
MAVRARLAPPRPDREEWQWHQIKSMSLPVTALLAGDRRMEAEAYLLSGFGLRAALEARPNGWVRFGHLANIWQPSRLKGIQVTAEFGTPFLAATQVFDLRPVPRKWLALERTEKAAQRFVQEGMILVTCSGSVGRATLAYTPHLDTLISHDLLRVEAIEAKHWGWLYAYLRATTTRAMMTSAQYGHIIKHLEVSHLNALPIPEVPDSLLQHFNERTHAIVELRDKANAATLAAEKRFAECLSPLPVSNNGENGFAINASAMFSSRRRIDAWPHVPLVQSIKTHLESKGQGLIPLRECGYQVWVPGRYKRVPVEEGVTYLDSSDLFEINPDLSKQFADCSFGDQYRGRVQKGWLLMASSGQVYGIIGGVILSNAFFADKVVSNHVIRIAPIAKPAVRSGYLLTALAHPLLGRPIIKSFAFGSSVPEIDTESVNEFAVVRLALDDEDYIADQAEQAAEWRAEADVLETEIADEAEQILSRFLAGEPLEPHPSSELGVHVHQKP